MFRARHGSRKRKPITPEANEVSLVEMSAGQRGVVRKVEGGYGLQKRLENLGIRPDQEIVKVSEMLLAGPVVVRVQGTEVALGRGMATKVSVTIL